MIVVAPLYVNLTPLNSCLGCLLFFSPFDEQGCSGLLCVHVSGNTENKFLPVRLLICSCWFTRITGVERYCLIFSQKDSPVYSVNKSLRECVTAHLDNTIHCTPDDVWNRPYGQVWTHYEVMLNKRDGLRSSTESMVPFILKRLDPICVKRPMDFLCTYLYINSFRNDA